MKPLLAHTYEPHRITYPCFVQPKLNGVRALYQQGCFQSRDQLPFPAGLLDHLAKPLLEIFPPNVILDGELYVHGWPLGRINGAVTPVRKEQKEDTRLVEYHVFDVVDFGKSFIDRWSKLINRPTYFSGPSIFAVDTAYCSTEAFANHFYAEKVSEGYEGMMYRLGDCPYTVPKQKFTDTKSGYEVRLRMGMYTNARTAFLSDKDNRCWHLLKRKDWQDDEFLFVSLEATTGTKGERGFQMWCLTKNGKRFKFGAGLSDAELDFYLENPPVGRLVKGKYLCLSEEGIPLNGTILAVL